MNKCRNFYLGFLFTVMALALVFAACIPFEGSFEEVVEKAGGGGEALAGTITITGDKWVNAILTAIVNTPEQAGVVTYLWERKELTNDIVVGNSATYTVVSADKGKEIVATVTRAGYKNFLTSEEFLIPADAPIAIYNENQLRDIVVNDPDISYILVNNVNINGFWTTIGNPVYGNQAFLGTFDGKGKTIAFSAQNYYNTSYGDFGLFDSIGNGGVVKNLKLTGSITVNAPDKSIVSGALACVSRGHIYNVSSNVSIYVDTTGENGWGAPNVGGIVGLMRGGTIENCYSTGTMWTVNTSCIVAYTGSIVGEQESGTVQYCWASGSLIANNDGTLVGNKVGGIVGGQNNASGWIYNCVALNNPINGYDSTDAGRITGNVFYTGSGLNGNYAKSDMTVNQSNSIIGSITDKNGESVDINLVQEDNGIWWTDTAGWLTDGPKAVWGGTGEEKPWKWNQVSKRPMLWFENSVNY